MKVLIVNVTSKTYEEKEIKEKGIIEYAVKRHLEEESYKYDVFSEKNLVILGGGPLLGTNFFGVRRLTVVFRSPLTKGLYVSTCGGAAYALEFLPIDIIEIRGKSEKPVVIVVGYDWNENKLKVDFHEIEKEELKKIYEKEGTRALSEYLKEKFAKEEKIYSILVVGPAAFNTDFAGICKWQNEVFDIAARGGVGSVLARAHNVVGIVILGNGPRKKKDLDANDIVIKVLGKKYIDVLNEAGKKYREKGTFGGNYPKLRDLTPMYYWGNFEISKEERTKIWKEKVMSDKFYGKFKVEKSLTCGEPCPITCKKIVNGKKVDYEPYQALGPLLGIFDFELVSELVDEIDKLGFDAIEFGNLMAAIFRGMKEGKIREFNVNLDDEKEKAKFIKEFARKLAFGEIELGKKGTQEFFETGVFAKYEGGGISPTQYWALGNYLPLPHFQGRYWTYYHPGEFLSPEELAQKVLQRVLNELLLDNFGICRFHRGVFEKIFKELGEILGISDIYEYSRGILRKIVEYNKKAGLKPGKVPEVVKKLIIKAAEDFPKTEEGKKWAEKILKEKDKAVEEYISKTLEEFEKLLQK